MKKVTKGQMIVVTCICCWIILLNVIATTLQLPEKGIHYVNWCFFLINILYFLGGDADMKKRFKDTLCGSIVGLLLAALCTFILAMLWEEQGMGGHLSYVPSVCIPLAICIACIVILHPILPMFFNNCGFAYFLVALTIMANEPWGGNPITNLGAYIISTILGHIIANGGSLLIRTVVGKKLAEMAK